MRRLFSTIALSAVTLSGCVRLNQDHCGNQDGNVTCQERGGESQYCSVCVSDNDGCVDVEPTPACGGGAATEQAGSSTAVGTGVAASTTEPSDTTVVDPSISSEPSDGSTDAGTTTDEPADRCGNGQRDVDEECEGEDVGDTTCASLGLGNGDVTCGDRCLFNTDECSEMAACGNNVQEHPELCDTEGTFACEDLNPGMYSGGDASCTGCQFDYSECDSCTPPNASCAQANDTCCEGTSCNCLLTLCACN